MKIFIITIDHTFFYPQLWHQVLEKHAASIQGAFFFRRLPNKYSLLKYKMTEFNFIGARNAFKIFYTGMSLQLKHVMRYGRSVSVKALFQDYNVPVYSYKTIRDPRFEQKLKDLSPDLVISAGTHQIIPKNILDIPKDGVLNKHGSLLPKYAGFWPLFWALYHNESQAGVTFHKMISKLDAGEMVHQKKFSIEPQDSLFDVQKKSLLLSGEMIGDIIDYYRNHQRLPIFHVENSEKNTEKNPKLSPFPTRADRLYFEKVSQRRII
ncbi:MAG: hypothetical protein HYS98_05470 [Deltaproteobacteria bacterium]|nr:hypothetical protein [Deltaproteobacteria bacterium]